MFQKESESIFWKKDQKTLFLTLQEKSLKNLKSYNILLESPNLWIVNIIFARKDVREKIFDFKTILKNLNTFVLTKALDLLTYKDYKSPENHYYLS